MTAALTILAALAWISASTPAGPRDTPVRMRRRGPPNTCESTIGSSRRSPASRADRAALAREACGSASCSLLEMLRANCSEPRPMPRDLQRLPSGSGPDSGAGICLGRIAHLRSEPRQGGGPFNAGPQGALRAEVESERADLRQDLRAEEPNLLSQIGQA